MATTIKESFLKLKSNLEITYPQKSTVSTRQNEVRRVIEKDFDILDSFLTGSYSRSTMIAPLKDADIDIFVVLNPSYYKAQGQATLLDQIKRSLKKSYPTTPKISRNGQAITITFSDFLVDVVPSFKRKGGGFLIPDSINQTWISTNPKVHVDVMNSQNEQHNGDLVPLVKMIKGWNRNIGFAFVSFYLELITIEILDDITISNFSSGMRYFFDKGRTRIKNKAKDPVDYGGYVNGLRNCPTVDKAISRFETGYQRAIKAEEYAREGDIENAVAEWKKIFGNYFPSFG